MKLTIDREIIYMFCLIKNLAMESTFLLNNKHTVLKIINYFLSDLY